MAETNSIRRCMIVFGDGKMHRDLADRFGRSAQGMWTTPLQRIDTGEHAGYINEGMIDPSFAAMMENPEALQAGCAALGITVPLGMAQALLAQADVSEDEPFAAMARLGLQMVQVPL